MYVYDEANNLAKAIQESKEYLVFIKTKISLQDEIYNVIRENHSYECFEFAIFKSWLYSVCNVDNNNLELSDIPVSYNDFSKNLCL